MVQNMSANPHEPGLRHLSHGTGGLSRPGLAVPGAYGGYWLVERLGTGGMAEVYRAQDPTAADPQRSFVVKRLKTEYRNHESALRLFVEEAKLAASIRHENIVPVYDLIQTSEGEIFITMEHVDGLDLRWLLNMVRRRGRQLPVWFALFICSEVLEALHYISELADPIYGDRNVVHCDVTPENVFIASTGAIKLGDFGVAVEDARPEDHHPGQLRGKLPYCSPEQAQGERLDARSDVYSCAALLWECLTGRPMVNGRDRDSALRAVLSPERARPSTLNPQVSPQLDEVVLAALSPDKARRTPSARVFRDRLRSLLVTMHEPVTRADVVAAMAKVLAPRAGHGTTPRPQLEILDTNPPPEPTEVQDGLLPSEDLDFATWIHFDGQAFGPMDLHAALDSLQDRAAMGLERFGLSVSGRDPMPAADFMLLCGIDMESGLDTSAVLPRVSVEVLSLASLFTQHTHARSSGALVVCRDTEEGPELRQIRISNGRLVDVWSPLATFRTWAHLTEADHAYSGPISGVIHRCLADGKPIFERLDPHLQGSLQVARLHELHRQLQEMFAWSDAETYFVPLEIPSASGAPSLARLVPEILVKALDKTELHKRLERHLAYQVAGGDDLAAHMDAFVIPLHRQQLVTTILQAATLAEGLMLLPEEDRFLGGATIYALHAVGLLRYV